MNKSIYLLLERIGEAQVNNTGVVKKGCTNMCAPATVNLYKQTEVDLFFNIEETLSYGRHTLANFQKFSMLIATAYLQPPSVRSSKYYELTDKDHATYSQ